MTQDKARKTATRQRMTETGESYCEARRMTGEAGAGEAGRGGAGPGEAGAGEAGRTAREDAESSAGELAAQARVWDLGGWIGQALQQFDVIRERAEEVMSRAERMFNPGREEPPRRDRADPGAGDPGAGETWR